MLKLASPNLHKS